MTKRFFVTAVAVLIGSTVIAAEQTGGSVASVASSAKTSNVELRGSSATIDMVPVTTRIQMSASRITYDADAQETTLEGKARVQFDGKDMTGDVILLKRMDGPKGAVVVIAAIMK